MPSESEIEAFVMGFRVGINIAKSEIELNNAQEIKYPL